MALLKASIKLIIREHPYYSFSGRVLTFGVPEIYASYNELKGWFPSLAGTECSLTPAETEITENDIGRKLGWVSSTSFFKAFGITEVVSIDIPGSEHRPGLIHDLNQPLPDEYVGGFDLLVNPGTIEHIFDIRVAFQNVVRALKIGGVVIHQVPVYSYNGGYYSINPNVLNDFYSANGFISLKTYIIMWDLYRAYTGRQKCYTYTDSTLGDRYALADYDQCRYSPHILFMARKGADLPETVIPLQFSGVYTQTKVVEGKDENSAFTLIKTWSKRLAPILYRIFPFSIVYYFHAWGRRLFHLWHSRKSSFWI